MDFALSSPQSLFGIGVESQPITVTLTGTGSLSADTTFTPSGPGSFNPTSVTVLAGSVAGASVPFTVTPTNGGTVSVLSAGGFVATHTISLTVARARSVTAKQIIEQAAGILGTKAPGEPVDATEMVDWLSRMNMMIDGWRTDSMLSYASQAVTGTLKGGAKSLTIGPTGDIITAYRPIRLEDGSFFTVANGGSIYDYPFASITQSQYNDIQYKTLGTLGPSGVYYEPSLPNGTLYIYPQSNGDVTLNLQALIQLVEFDSLTTSYVLAPGYERLIVYSIAEEMAPDYQRQLSPSATKILSIARRSIKRLNHVVPAMGEFRIRGNVLTGWET